MCVCVYIQYVPVAVFVSPCARRALEHPLFVTTCVTVRACLCLRHLSVDRARLHLAGFLVPSWQEAVREGLLSDGAGDKHADGGENILFILDISGNMQKPVCAHANTQCVRVCFRSCEVEREEKKRVI